MFDSLHYVPILKGKQGEFGALKELSMSVRLHVTPLIEIPPVGWNYKDSCPNKTIDDHIESFPDKICNSWGTDKPVFVDLYFVEPGDRTADGQHPLNVLMLSVHAKGIKAIPVTSLDRSPDFQKAVSDIVKAQGQGVCLRLSREELDNFVSDESTVTKLLSDLGLSYRECDLILDLQDISSLDIGDVVASCCKAIQTLPNVKEWRTLTLAGCSFPSSLAVIPANSSKILIRKEYILWQRLVAIAQELPRVPSFGDYGVSHSDFPDIDPRKMKMSVNLRYTSDNSWLVLKARGANSYGYTQFNGLCRVIVSKDEYLGRDFSWGDKYIYDCSCRNDRPGNASTWRQVGTSHHIAFVSKQIANYPLL